MEDVRAAAKELGWTLISDIYKNLDTEIILDCPEGHRIYTTYKRWRQRQECPQCLNNPLKNIEIAAIPKKSGVIRVIALDTATKTSGYSIFDDKELVAYGNINFSQIDDVERIAAVKQWVISLIVNWKPDLIGFEDIQLQEHGGEHNAMGVTTYKVLAKLQGVLQNIFFEHKIRNILVFVNTWRSYCEIKGKTKNDKKRSAQLKVKEWYDISVTQDEAEAICLGKYLVDKEAKQTILIEW